MQGVVEVVAESSGPDSDTSVFWIPHTGKASPTCATEVKKHMQKSYLFPPEVRNLHSAIYYYLNETSPNCY